MRSIDDIIHWREQGLVMTPVQDGTKKPVTVNNFFTNNKVVWYWGWYIAYSTK